MPPMLKSLPGWLHFAVVAAVWIAVERGWLTSATALAILSASPLATAAAHGMDPPRGPLDPPPPGGTTRIVAGLVLVLLALLLHGCTGTAAQTVRDANAVREELCDLTGQREAVRIGLDWTEAAKTAWRETCKVRLAAAEQEAIGALGAAKDGGS